MALKDGYLLFFSETSWGSLHKLPPVLNIELTDAYIHNW